MYLYQYLKHCLYRSESQHEWEEVHQMKNNVGGFGGIVALEPLHLYPVFAIRNRY